MKRLFVGVLMTGLLIGSIAIGQDVGSTFGMDSDHKAVQLLLRGYHGVPERGQFEAASPKARDVLQGFASDPLGGLFRERAILALGHWPDADTLWLYRRSLNDATLSTAARHQILLRGAEVFGESLLEDATSFLNQDNVAARITGVAALSRIGTDAAFARIDAHASVENNKVVLEAISDYGRRLR